MLLCLPLIAHGHHRDATKWDDDFAKYQSRYASPPIKRDWRLLKAQCAVESSLRPDAVSHAGAIGLCQLLAATFARYSDPGDHPMTARSSIKAASRYMRFQWGNWSGRPRTATCQHELSLAGYNAGLGNILHSQRLADDALCWGGIGKELHNVTGTSNATETRNYITRNRDAYHRMGGWRIW